MIYPLSVQTPDVNTTTKKRTLYQKHKNVIAIEKRKTSGVWNQRIVYQSHIALKHPKGFRFGGEAEFVGQTRWCYHVLILRHGSIHFPRYATTFPAGPVKDTGVGQDFFFISLNSRQCTFSYWWRYLPSRHWTFGISFSLQSKSFWNHQEWISFSFWFQG